MEAKSPANPLSHNVSKAEMTLIGFFVVMIIASGLDWALHAGHCWSMFAAPQIERPGAFGIYARAGLIKNNLIALQEPQASPSQAHALLLQSKDEITAIRGIIKDFPTFNGSKITTAVDKLAADIDSVPDKLPIAISDATALQDLSVEQAGFNFAGLALLKTVFSVFAITCLLVIVRIVLRMRAKYEASLADANRQLEAIANNDPLTELLNRRGFEKALTLEATRAQRGGGRLIGVLIDCDDFKQFNEKFGHAVGDLVLKQVAGALQTSTRGCDHVSRIGGDEFVILLPDTHFAEAVQICDRVRLSIASRELHVAGQTVQITASFGVAPLPAEISSIEELLTVTRMALKKSKSLGKNRVSAEADVVDSTTVGASAPALEDSTTIGTGSPLLQDGTTAGAGAPPLQEMRDGSAVSIYKQNIVNIANSAQVFGVELLCRGPAGPFHLPADLFRLAVSENILTSVDLTCLKKAAKLAATLPPKTHVHFNLLPSTLVDTPTDAILQILTDALGRVNVCIELSEQQFIGSPSYLRDKVLDLKRHGIKIAIDDVGFGRSSLESLILFEPEFAKIDQSCVENIAQEPGKMRAMERLVKVLHSCGAQIIAEGIEKESDARAVAGLGIRLGQGFLWDAPSPLQANSFQESEGALAASTLGNADIST